MSETSSELEQVEARRLEQRHNLELILANPVLAAEAFPDPERRAKILPLLDYIDGRVAELRRKNEGRMG